MNPSELKLKREAIAGVLMEAAEALTARDQLETRLVDVTQRNEKLKRERNALKAAIKKHKARARDGYWRNAMVDKTHQLMRALGMIAMFESLAQGIKTRDDNDGQPRTAAEKIKWVIDRFSIRNQERAALMAATRRHRKMINEYRGALVIEGQRNDRLRGELNTELQRYDALETEAITVIEELETRLITVEERRIIPIAPRRRAA